MLFSDDSRSIPDHASRPLRFCAAPFGRVQHSIPTAIWSGTVARTRPARQPLPGGARCHGQHLPSVTDNEEDSNEEDGNEKNGPEAA